MKVIFLGTNGWYDTQTGATISVLLESQNEYIILDAGNGISKLDAYITDNKPIYLFLSHFHLDHICGLHILNKFRFEQGLNIIGQEGTSDILHSLLKFPFTVSLDELPFRTKIYEFPVDESHFQFKVSALPLRHASHCLGYRFEINDTIISYCTDTGYCTNAVSLASNADLLIAECALQSGQTDEEWPHLNPESAARIAQEANVKKLCLIHFDVAIYTTIQKRKEAELKAKIIFPDTISTIDGMEISI